MNLDDLLNQIKSDERNDATILSPIEYARMRGIYAQRVYKALRDRKLKRETCEHCGHQGISVELADELFGFEKEVDDGESDSDN